MILILVYRPGMRTTRPRQTVISVLERERDRQLTAQDLHRKALAVTPRIGLATVYRTLAALENEGVERIFGVPGEENLDVVESLRTSGIELVVTRHEQSAAFMAATYGRLTGTPGLQRII